MEQHLATLNEEQRRAVVHPGGPLLVLAGAGSGKTRVLTLRLAWLIRNRGIAPRRLLAVTFTNKAAAEMQNRVRAILGEDSEAPWVSTFHSACLRILRYEVERVPGLMPGFAVYDDDESLRLLKMVVEEANPARTIDPRALAGVIDRAKNDALGPDELAASARGDFDPRVQRFYATYQERLRKANAVDFGDLILETIRLLEREPQVLGRYRDRFAHVLVDEYQDTNRAQYLLTRLLADHGDRNVCVVGDEDQSIYSFRGADIGNILDFGRDFPGAEVVRLERNYRSTGTILDAATAVVEVNTERLGKKLWTEAGRGDAIVFKVAADEIDEACRAVEIARKEIQRGRRPGEIAVFFRTNAQSRVLEEAFIASRLPFVLLGGQRFYERKEIRDALAYLKVVLNPDDDVSLLRILNEPPRRIGDSVRQRVTSLAVGRGISCWQAVCDLARDEDLPGRARKPLLGFVEIVEDLRRDAPATALPHLALRVLDRSGMRARYEEEDTFEARGRLDNLQELLNATADYVQIEPQAGLLDFLDRVSLVSDTDSLPEEAEAAGRIALMTVHSAKGLEFPVVIVVGMDEGVFPHFRASQADRDLQEERRLAYVAITRAERRLYLLRARRRRVGGNWEDKDESRFLHHIPQGLLTGDVWTLACGRSTPGQAHPPERRVVYDVADPDGRPLRSRFDRHQAGEPSRQGDRPAGTRRERTGLDPAEGAAPRAGSERRVVRDLDDSAASMLKVGARVLHPEWGEGEVRGLEGTAAATRARIYFRRGGMKLVYLARAELEILSG